jgi:hypothetical protein
MGIILKAIFSEVVSLLFENIYENWFRMFTPHAMILLLINFRLNIFVMQNDTNLRQKYKKPVKLYL